MSRDLESLVASPVPTSGTTPGLGSRDTPPRSQPDEGEATHIPASRRLGGVTHPRSMATFALIGLNVLVYIANLLLSNWVTRFGALVPEMVVRSGQWWRLIAAGFLHADLMHIGLNLYAFYGLGQLAERFFGAKRLIIIYGLSLLGASSLVTLFSPLGTPTVGASGAIMGVLGALVALFWTYRQSLAGGRGLLNRLIQMALINIGIGLLPGISWWGHLGGFVFGTLVGLALIPRYEQRCVALPSGETRCFLVLNDGNPHSARSYRPWGYLSLIAIGETLLVVLAFWLRG
jgi:membrane associated rhomboid family serine protease